MTLAHVFRPATRNHSIVYDGALIVGGSLFIALAAQVTVLLPFSPVPVTGQTFAVLLIGLLYGSRRGLATVAAYLTEGLAGLPVFAGATGGFVHLVGPTGGYLLGFAVAAYAVGLLAERGWTVGVFRAALAMTLGNVVIYSLGAAWLAVFAGVQAALAAGVLPFLVGDVTKIVLGATLLPLITAVVRKYS